MSRFFASLFASYLLLAVCGHVSAGVPLDIAIRTGKVDVTITGRGVSSGDAMGMYVQKKVPGTIHIDIEPGTVFRCKTGRAQSMVFRHVRFEKVRGGYKRATEIVLKDNTKRHFILEAYCRDHGKPTPTPSDQFVIEPKNKTEAAILAQGTEINVTNRVLQVAIWLHRSSEDPSQMRGRFSVSADEFKVATGLVDSARRSTRDPASAVAASDVQVELRRLMAGLRKRLRASRDSASLRRGDRAKVESENAALRATRNGPRVLLELSQGDEVEVLRVAGDRVFCVAKSGDKTRRGWLAKSDLGSGVSRRPIVPASGVLRESALEALDKLDIKVNTDDTRVRVGTERNR